MDSMSNALHFVKGAISKKDFIPSLKHVLIKDGVIQAFNGHIALSSPVDFNHNIVPVAADFIKAVDQCSDSAKMHVTKGGKLSIKDGSFKVFVKLTDAETFPDVLPEGEYFECGHDCNIVEIFKTLSPFIGNDASRPWSAGIIIRDSYAYATNNVVLSCYTRPVSVPWNIIIPEAAVKEIIRIKQRVIAIQVSKNSCTFHFEEGRWLRTNLLEQEAPDFSPIFSKCSYDRSKMDPIAEDLQEKFERLKPFCDKKNPILILRKDGIFTSHDESGASDSEYSFPIFRARYEPLLSVVQNADYWDLKYFPNPCSFVGENISGVIVGMRMEGYEG